MPINNPDTVASAHIIHRRELLKLTGAGVAERVNRALAIRAEAATRD